MKHKLEEIREIGRKERNFYNIPDIRFTDAVENLWLSNPPPTNQKEQFWHTPHEWFIDYKRYIWRLEILKTDMHDLIFYVCTPTWSLARTTHCDISTGSSLCFQWLVCNRGHSGWEHNNTRKKEYYSNGTIRYKFGRNLGVFDIHAWRFQCVGHNYPCDAFKCTMPT